MASEFFPRESRPSSAPSDAITFMPERARTLYLFSFVLWVECRRAEPNHECCVPLDGPYDELDVIHVRLSAQNLETTSRSLELKAVSAPTYPLVTC